MDAVSIGRREQDDLLQLVAGVLHLGNMDFAGSEVRVPVRACVGGQLRRSAVLRVFLGDMLRLQRYACFDLM